jgi:hypothetical protein
VCAKPFAGSFRWQVVVCAAAVLLLAAAGPLAGSTSNTTTTVTCHALLQLADPARLILKHTSSRLLNVG